MKTQLTQKQSVLVIVTALALFLTGIFFYTNRSLKDQLNKEKIKSEALRSKLENEITGLNLNMEQLLAENKRMDEQLATIVRENESLKLHNALLDGEELSSRYDRSVTMKFHNQDKNLMASLTGTPSRSQNGKRTELTYKPEQKLVKGIYRC